MRISSPTQQANSARELTKRAGSPVLPEVLKTWWSSNGSAALGPARWACTAESRSRGSVTISSNRSTSVCLPSVGSSARGAPTASGPIVAR